MLKGKAYTQSVREITLQIHPVEQAMDAMIEMQSKLLGVTPVAGRRAGLSFAATQEALTAMAASLQQAVAARGQMAAAHSAFSAIYEGIGIDVTGTGSGQGSPALYEHFSKPEAPLRVVA